MCIPRSQIGCTRFSKFPGCRLPEYTPIVGLKLSDPACAFPDPKSVAQESLDSQAVAPQSRHSKYGLKLSDPACAFPDPKLEEKERKEKIRAWKYLCTRSSCPGNDAHELVQLCSLPGRQKSAQVHVTFFSAWLFECGSWI